MAKVVTTNRICFCRGVSNIDGDTIKVILDSEIETIRLIGVDTPESVHPRKPVEYFGKSASLFSKLLR
ncbi:thermonuclease family protein [Kosmotoga olearia]|jgi:micrococcal nuclease|uniref:thermonuclease family protein n=1 Tax=Kosmotoga olearia TaxID=651457 RepID=UPI00059C0F33